MADLSNVVRMLIHQLDATRSYLLPGYCDEDEKARAVIAFAESALAAETTAPAPAADGEHEELAQWLEGEARSCAAQFHDRITRAAALLRQLPPDGLVAVEYFHIATSARIVGEASEKWSGECWNVYNSRHVNPCTEFRTVADAVAALKPPQGGEVEV